MTAVTTQPAGVPTAGQVRARLRRGRRAHRGSRADFLTDLYLLCWIAAIYGGAVVEAGRRFLSAPPAGALGEPGQRAWIAVSAVLVTAALGWLLLRSVGPLLATPADLSWAAGTPVDRRGWLLLRFVHLLAATGLAASLVSLPVAGLGGGADLGWALLGGLSYGVAGAAFAVTAQATCGRWARSVAPLLGAVGAAVAAGCVAAYFAGRSLPVPPGAVLVVVALAGLPLAGVAVVAAVRALPDLGRAALTGGAVLVSAAVTALISVDPALLFGVVNARRWRRIGRVRSARFRPGGRSWVLLQAEVQRLVRRPGPLAVGAGLALTQYAIAVAVPSVAGVSLLVGAYLVADRLAGGLRMICRSPGLRRAIGGRERSVRLVHLVLPAAGATLWWLATWPAGAHHGVAGLPFVAGVLVAVYRAATRPPLFYDGVTIDTPFGLIPVDLVRQVIRGPDVVGILILGQLLLT